MVLLRRPETELVKNLRRRIAAGEKVRIGAVCVGNTCRSPAAEYYLREAFRRRGIKNVEVFSAGLSAAKGSPANPLTREILTEEGIPAIAEHQSQPFDLEHHHDSDLLLFMDKRARDYAVGSYVGAEDNPDFRGALRKAKQRFHTLKGFGTRTEWLTYVTPYGGTIVDPWWVKKKENYRAKLAQIKRYCEGVAERLDPNAGKRK